MKPQTNPPGVVAALVAALGELRNPTFDKSNDAFRNYRYASLAAHVEASRATLAKHGLALVQPVFPIETGDGYTIATRIYHGASGESLDLGAFEFQCDPAQRYNPQKVIALLTYYRRASLAAALGFVGDDDDDAETVAAPMREADAARHRRDVAASTPRATIGEAIAGNVAKRLKAAEPPPDAVPISKVLSDPGLLDRMTAANLHIPDDGYRRVRVLRYTSKPGHTRGKDWVRHAVLIADNGEEIWCSTFDATIGTAAKSFLNKDAEVATKPSAGGCDLVAIRAVSAPPPPPQPQPEIDNDDDDDDNDIPF